MSSKEVARRIGEYAATEVEAERILGNIEDLEDRLSPAKLGENAARIIREGVMNIYLTHDDKLREFSRDTGVMIIRPHTQTRLLEIIKYSNALAKTDSKKIQKRDTKPEKERQTASCRYVEKSLDWRGIVKEQVSKKEYPNLHHKSLKSMLKGSLEGEYRLGITIICRRFVGEQFEGFRAEQGGITLGRHEIAINVRGDIEDGRISLKKQYEDQPGVIKVACGENARNIVNPYVLETVIKDYHQQHDELLRQGNDEEFIYHLLELSQELLRNVSHPNFETDAIQ